MNDLDNNFITTIKKKKPSFNKQVDKTTSYNLIPKPKITKHKTKSFSLDEIIEMINKDPIKTFSIKSKRVVLNKIIEEPEPKIDYHLQLLHFI